MPSVYQPALIQVRPQYSSGQPDQLSTPENVMWWQGANLAAFPLTAIQLAVIGNAFDTAWANLWKQVGTDHYYYTGSIITDWSLSTGYQVNSVGTFAQVAGENASYAPASASMLTSLQSLSMPKYRGGHGRLYLPFMSGTVINDEFTWTAAAVAAVQAQWPNVDTAMSGVGSGNGGPFEQMLYRERNTVGKAALYGVTHRVVQPRIATQRRRLRKAPHH